MSGSNALVNLGDISKPVNTLIEKISSAIGILYEPKRIIKKAMAEAESDKIKVLSKLEIADIAKRALERFIKEEIIKQVNIENIIGNAILEIRDNATPERIDNDWIINFFDKCKIISDKEMQILWGKILSGEANNPGSFSKRTINLLASLNKKDTVLFTNLCQFGFSLNNEFVIFLYDSQNEFYKKYYIDFTSLTYLDNLGLIKFGGLDSFVKLKVPQSIDVFYFDRQIQIKFPKVSDNVLNYGKVFLSQLGQELFPICGANPEKEIMEFTVNKWKELGATILTDVSAFQW